MIADLPQNRAAVLILMKRETREEVVEDEGDRILESRRPLGGLEIG